MLIAVILSCGGNVHKPPTRLQVYPGVARPAIALPPLPGIAAICYRAPYGPDQSSSPAPLFGDPLVSKSRLSPPRIFRRGGPGPCPAATFPPRRDRQARHAPCRSDRRLSAVQFSRSGDIEI